MALGIEETISLLMSGGALVIAISSFVFAVMSWRETHRPVVTAFIRCPFSGNVGSGLEIVVSNSGNRPAKDIRLHTSKNELKNSIAASVGDKMRIAVERCFSNETFIPVLEGGKEVSNSFGIFTANNNKPDTWHYKSVLEIIITYESLTGRKYKNQNKLRIVCNKGFALNYFEHNEKKP